MRTCIRALVVPMALAAAACVAGAYASSGGSPSGGGGEGTTGAPVRLPDPVPSAETLALNKLRSEYLAAPPTERARLAEALLEGLDRYGQGRGPEAVALANEILAIRPDDPLLLWRRGDARRRAGQSAGALSDLQHLIEVAPDHPLAVRARRALPSLMLRTGRREESAAADEELLASGIADPGTVLARLARTYALVGDLARVQDALSRLAEVDPSRLRLDADTSFLAAEVADKLGTRAQAGAALLRFANVFPADPRRDQALLRAARAYEDSGQHDIALRLMEESVETSRRPAVAAAGRLEKGELLAGIGEHEDAVAAYEEALAGAADPATAQRAFERIVEVTVQTRGTKYALALLAGRSKDPRPLVAGAARAQFGALVDGITADLVGDPAEAAFVVELARRAGVEDILRPGVVLAAAALREQVGNYANAAALAKTRASLPPPDGDPARAMLARTIPRDAAGILAAPERLEALRREEAWPLVLKAVGTPESGQKSLDPQRVAAARAAFMAGDPTWAGELLDPIAPIRGIAALMRGDARALAEDWSGACEDYRAAQRSAELGEVERAWAEVRIASCEAREGRADDARGRLQVLLGRDPGDPARLAAEKLLAEIPAAKAARGPAR